MTRVNDAGQSRGSITQVNHAGQSRGSIIETSNICACGARMHQPGRTRGPRAQQGGVRRARRAGVNGPLFHPREEAVWCTNGPSYK
eukprot:7066881-Pyramimonas_sp.AAC.1